MDRPVAPEDLHTQTFTMRLEGERVTLASFTEALEVFHRTIRDTIGRVRQDRVDVVVESLSAGSAYVSAAVLARREVDHHIVRQRFDSFARAAQDVQGDKLNRQMARHMLRVNEVLDHPDIDSILLSTTAEDYFVGMPSERTVESGDEIRRSRVTRGEVRGRIETIARRSHRFLIYDLLHDKPVTCYLPPEMEETLRGLWGKLAVVAGQVTRDPITDRPASIRDISSIDPLEEGDPDAWRSVVGILPVDGAVLFDLHRYKDEMQ